MEVELKFIFGRFAVYSPLGAMRCDLMFVCLSLFHFGLFFTPPSHSFPSLSHSEFNVYMALLYDCYRKSPIFRFLFNSRVLWKSSFISSASTSFFSSSYSSSFLISTASIVYRCCSPHALQAFFVRFSLVLCSFRCTKMSESISISLFSQFSFTIRLPLPNC